MTITNNKIGIQYGFWSKDRSGDFLPYVPKVAKLGFEVFEFPPIP
jgi:hypothetical protein